jgi:hypothetical protein
VVAELLAVRDPDPDADAEEPGADERVHGPEEEGDSEDDNGGHTH